jgi:AcrR family transcriptional regulator
VTRPTKEERRGDILEAAKRIFAERGYHPTRMSDVASAAGVSHGTIFWHFGSKEELFHELMDEEERALRAHIDTVAGNPTGDVFRRSVLATFEFFEADRDTVRLLFRDPLILGNRFDRHLGGIYEGFIDDIEKSISDAQRAGQVIGAPARVIAFSVAALISGLALRRLVTDDGLPASEVADLVVTLILDGLRPRAVGDGPDRCAKAVDVRREGSRR